MDIGIIILCNGIVKELCIPADWESNVVLPIYKGKGDPMECRSLTVGTCYESGGKDLQTKNLAADLYR